MSVTKQLIESRCNIDPQNTHGVTSLFIATKKGHTVIVEQLIAARCDVHFALKNGLTVISITTRNGHTPIMTMIQNCLYCPHKFFKKDMFHSLTTKLDTCLHTPAIRQHELSPSHNLATHPCLRSTKMLTKRYQVNFFNDPHADSILVSTPTSVSSHSVTAKFCHIVSRFKETKPLSFSEHIFDIYMSISYEHHFAQLRVDVRKNRLTKRQERATMSRWPITYDDATEKHTLAHRNTKPLRECLTEITNVSLCTRFPGAIFSMCMCACATQLMWTTLRPLGRWCR